MLAPLAASWKTTYRFTMSRSDSALGRGELSLRRSAGPRRVAEVRNRGFGTHGLALSARQADNTVNLAYTPGKPPRPRDVWLGADVLGADGDDGVVDAADLSFRPAPLSLDAACASMHWRRVDWPRSLQHVSRGLAQDHVHDRTAARKRSGRDPPGSCGCDWPHGVQAEILSSVPAVPLRPRAA